MIKLILKPSEIIPEDYNGKFINHYSVRLKDYQVIKKIVGRSGRKLTLDRGVAVEYENGHVVVKS